MATKNLPVWPSGETISVPLPSSTNEPGDSGPNGGNSCSASEKSGEPQAQGEQANAALLAASRGAEPRTAEAARELLPARYPYVYEFGNALQIDPSNISLRRELAYLLLEMGNREAAEDQFRNIDAKGRRPMCSRPRSWASCS